MSVNPIQVTVNGKEISSKPIERVLVRGEKESNVIVFTLNRIWNGIDISAAGTAYQVLGRNKNGDPSVDMLIKRDGATSDKFTLTWTVSSRFTNAPGALDIWISAIKGTGGFDFNWNTSPVRLYVSDGYIIGDYDTYDSLTRQLLDAIAVLVVSAQDSETNAAKSAAEALQSQYEAETSADDASNSAAESANHEAVSKTSANNSAASAAAALQSQEAAHLSEESAEVSADNARESADNAANSAADAFQMHNAAQVSEKAAKASATDSAASAAAAFQSQEAADDSAKNAEASANSAHMKALILDPTTGLTETIQTVVMNLYMLHLGAPTAQEYSEFQLTAEEYANIGMTAFDYAINGKKLLSKAKEEA